MLKILIALVLFVPVHGFAQDLTSGNFGGGVFFEKWSASVRDDNKRAPTVHRNYDLIGFEIIKPWDIYGPHAVLFGDVLLSTRSGGDSTSSLPPHHFMKESKIALLNAGGMWRYFLGASVSLSPLIYIRLPLDIDYLGRNSVFGALAGGGGLAAAYWIDGNWETELRLTADAEFVDRDHRSVSGLEGRVTLSYRY